MVKVRSVPLVVDLDGTLINSDLTQEAIVRVLATKPWFLFVLLFWLCRGLAYAKARLAEQCTVDVALLPYNSATLQRLRQEKEQGRLVVLCSASNQRFVSAVAAHLADFDEAYGSSATLNLGGKNKAAFLEQRYGAQGFDYIGDRSVDWPVWEKARMCLTVNADWRLRRRADASFRFVEHVSLPLTLAQRWQALMRSVRPHQWLKNLLLFVPMLAALAFQADNLILAGKAFIVFALTAASVYTLNDLMDLENDRRHPRKRSRPYASGQLPLCWGLLLVPALLCTALALAVVWLPAAFVGVLGMYYALTLAYSLYLRGRNLVDILSLAALYTLRIIGGGVVTALPISPWLLAFSMFLFFCLATIKRLTELKDPETHPEHVLAGRNYASSDYPLLQQFATTAGFLSVLVLSLYISQVLSVSRYSQPLLLWLVPPVLLYWIARLLLKTHRGKMTDDPVVFALTDRVSLAIGFLVALLITVAA